MSLSGLGADKSGLVQQDLEYLGPKATSKRNTMYVYTHKVTGITERKCETKGLPLCNSEARIRDYLKDLRREEVGDIVINNL